MEYIYNSNKIGIFPGETEFLSIRFLFPFRQYQRSTFEIDAAESKTDFFQFQTFRQEAFVFDGHILQFAKKHIVTRASFSPYDMNHMI